VHEPKQDIQALSNRERQCLREMAFGKRVQAIAETIGIAPVTVELHLRNVRAKLQASTNPAAVAKAISLGLIDPYR
tara:strand:+ start:123389 stop:123616 length:228 start_codon:yes stop_codon:yes gene_type:complete